MKYETVCGGSFMECRDGVQRWYSVRFQKNDGGRAESRRPKQQNDCTVRAVALAFSIPYDDAYDALAIAGRKSWQGMHFGMWANSDAPLHMLNKGLKWKPFPAVKGETRMNPAKFCELHKTGTWICRTAKHVTAVIDGVWMDTFSPNPMRCIYGAWEVTNTTEQEAR